MASLPRRADSLPSMANGSSAPGGIAVGGARGVLAQPTTTTASIATSARDAARPASSNFSVSAGGRSRAAPRCPGALFSCDCQTSCARARSPFAHSTSPRCAAISGSGRCSIARRRCFSASSSRPIRKCAQPMLSRMNGSSGESTSARSISARPSATRGVRSTSVYPSAFSACALDGLSSMRRVSFASTTSILSSFSATIATS